MSINGYEYAESDKLEALVMPYFDEVERDNVGNHIFIKRSKKPGAKKLFIDTHYDEIGMLVTEVKEGGFLSVIHPVGLHHQRGHVVMVSHQSADIPFPCQFSDQPDVFGTAVHHVSQHIKDIIIRQANHLQQLPEFVIAPVQV